MSLTVQGTCEYIAIFLHHQELDYLANSRRKNSRMVAKFPAGGVLKYYLIYWLAHETRRGQETYWMQHQWIQ